MSPTADSRLPREPQEGATGRTWKDSRRGADMRARAWDWSVQSFLSEAHTFT